MNDEENEYIELRRDKDVCDIEIQLLNKCLFNANQMIARQNQLTNILESGNGDVDSAKKLVRRQQLVLNECSTQLSQWRRNNKKIADESVNTDNTNATVNTNTDQNNINTTTNNANNIIIDQICPHFEIIPKREHSSHSNACQSSHILRKNQLSDTKKRIRRDLFIANQLNLVINRTITLDCDNTDDNSSERSHLNVSDNLNDDSHNQCTDNDLDSVNSDAIEYDNDLLPINFLKLYVCKPLSIPLTRLTAETIRNFTEKSCTVTNQSSDSEESISRDVLMNNELNSNLVNNGTITDGITVSEALDNDNSDENISERSHINVLTNLNVDSHNQCTDGNDLDLVNSDDSNDLAPNKLPKLNISLDRVTTKKLKISAKKSTAESEKKGKIKFKFVCLSEGCGQRYASFMNLAKHYWQKHDWNIMKDRPLLKCNVPHCVAPKYGTYGGIRYHMIYRHKIDIRMGPQ